MSKPENVKPAIVCGAAEWLWYVDLDDIAIDENGALRKGPDGRYMTVRQHETSRGSTGMGRLFRHPTHLSTQTDGAQMIIGGSGQLGLGLATIPDMCASRKSNTYQSPTAHHLFRPFLLPAHRS